MSDMEANITERRRQTRSSIYRYLYETKEFCSRQSLSLALGLSLPTIYQNLTELMDGGLVCYSGETQSTGGRKANGLSIVPDARIAVGVSITENRLRFVAADLRLNELAYRKVPCRFSSNISDYGAFLARELELFLEESQIDHGRLLGIGIAVPGAITSGGHHIVLAPTLGLRDTDLEELTRQIPYPIFVENDATSSGYAEWFIRGGQSSIAYLSLENGVGGAVMVNGAAYAGDNRRSGEFGHMCVEPGGLPCSCGRHGCLEAYCSARRISDDLGITLKEFFDGVENHVWEYELLWNDLLRHLAVGISNIRMALDCNVVLGGFLTQYLAPYLPLLKRYVAVNDPFAKEIDYIQLGVLSRHAVPLGAALHFVQEFLSTV